MGTSHTRIFRFSVAPLAVLDKLNLFLKKNKYDVLYGIPLTICKPICFVDDSAAESFNGNETAGHSSNASGGTHCREMAETNNNSKATLEPDEQPLNLSDSPFSTQLTSEFRLDDQSSDGKNKYKNLLVSDLKMEQEAKENGSKVRCFHVHEILQAHT